MSQAAAILGALCAQIEAGAAARFFPGSLTSNSLLNAGAHRIAPADCATSALLTFSPRTLTRRDSPLFWLSTSPRFPSRMLRSHVSRRQILHSFHFSSGKFGPCQARRSAGTSSCSSAGTKRALSRCSAPRLQWRSKRFHGRPHRLSRQYHGREGKSRGCRVDGGPSIWIVAQTAPRASGQISAKSLDAPASFFQVVSLARVGNARRRTDAEGRRPCANAISPRRRR
jgi:hypothetical protein